MSEHVAVVVDDLPPASGVPQPNAGPTAAQHHVALGSEATEPIGTQLPSSAPASSSGTTTEKPSVAWENASAALQRLRIFSEQTHGSDTPRGSRHHSLHDESGGAPANDAAASRGINLSGASGVGASEAASDRDSDVEPGSESELEPTGKIGSRVDSKDYERTSPLPTILPDHADALPRTWTGSFADPLTEKVYQEEAHAVYYPALVLIVVIFIVLRIGELCRLYRPIRCLEATSAAHHT